MELMMSFRRSIIEFANHGDKGENRCKRVHTEINDERKQVPITMLDEEREAAWWALMLRWFHHLSEQPWSQVAADATTGKFFPRDRDNPAFIASLLRLLDERPMPVNRLERFLGFPSGRLYRFLERAGVQWSARTKASILRAEIGLHGLCKSFQSYVDVVGWRVIRNGKIEPLPQGQPDAWRQLPFVETHHLLRPPPPPNPIRVLHEMRRLTKRLTQNKGNPLHVPA
jgi:hypothetical protein